jgi:hypothetical protein
MRASVRQVHGQIRHVSQDEQGVDGRDAVIAFDVARFDAFCKWWQLGSKAGDREASTASTS